MLLKNGISYNVLFPSSLHHNKNSMHKNFEVEQKAHVFDKYDIILNSLKSFENKAQTSLNLKALKLIFSFR